MKNTTSKILSLALVFGLLAGCAQATVTGATTVGVATLEERSLGNVIDDTTLTAEINSSYLQKDINNLFHKVDVQVFEGRVLLTGSVDKPEHRVEAVKLAWEVEGVVEVINEIQIAYQFTIQDYAKDSWITAQVKGKLLLNKDIRSINYNVDTVNGIVYLIGIAGDQQELDDATYLASTVKGAKEVISHVRLKGES